MHKHNEHLLVIEDEVELRESLTEILGHIGYHVTAVGTAHAARTALNEGLFDLVLLDVRLPDGDGIGLLQEFRAQEGGLEVMIMTGFADVEVAVNAMRLGAADFLRKPFDMDELLVRVEEVLKKRQLVQEHRVLRQEVQGMQVGEGVVGRCPSMQKVLETVRLAADSDTTILITGESGTGKEVIARTLHELSERAEKPFVPINCGAIPEELLESELFGHVKGAFTGAVKSRPGRFEVANGGTIFLDEIGDMSPKLQVKLLRVLQERCFEPVGSHQPVEVDVRVLAATHRDLEEEIRNGRFREDLYYRLNVIPLHMPPLRARGDDILLLAEHFMQQFNVEKGARIEGVDEETRRMMMRYSWPGNVRELSNLMERLATLKREGVVGVEDLPSKMLSEEERLDRDFDIDVSEMECVDFNALIEEYENRLLGMALKRCEWNKNQAAKFLSLNRTTLVEKLKKKGMQSPASN
ncbi:MAG TPA: sigma-54 dependent transcriptional regulator [Mariprofundaceae bacterium]|nr:sigma-54 dependent transcriptional regulator [Mariprofundaceae bacterium]